MKDNFDNAGFTKAIGEFQDSINLPKFSKRIRLMCQLQLQLQIALQKLQLQKCNGQEFEHLIINEV